MSKGKEVAVQEPQAAPVPAVAENGLPAMKSGNWGVIEELETTDLMVPKIFHQQALSVFVQEGIAKVGDWCDSMTKEVICPKDEPLELIIFGLYKTMVISVDEMLRGKFKLDKIIPVTKENAIAMAQKPYTEEKNGNIYRNQLFYNYYCLSPKRLKALPYVISLGSTKQKEATKLNTMITTLNGTGRSVSSVIFNFKSVERTKDTNKWQGVEISVGRPATEEEEAQGYAWYAKSKMQTFAVSDEDTKSDADSDNIPF
jgi:hypothetical protein